MKESIHPSIKSNQIKSNQIKSINQSNSLSKDARNNIWKRNSCFTPFTGKPFFYWNM